MNGARSRTKADVARKLADGLPIATFEDGLMEVHQIVERPAPQFETIKIKSAHRTTSPLRAISASALRRVNAELRLHEGRSAPIEPAE